MDPVESIGLWAVLWVGTHLGISSTRLRSRLISLVGAEPYRGVYSLVAFATLGPLIYEFAYHKHSGPLLWYLRATPEARGVTWLLMFLAFIFLAASLINPAPSSIGAASQNTPRGLQKLTRHPGLVAFSLFGIGHLLMNGWAGDVIFFGAFPVLGIAGGLTQDQRKLRELGDSYRQFMDATSFFPFLALLSGRQKWQPGDMPWIVIVVGIVVAAVTVAVHPYIFGGNPLG